MPGYRCVYQLYEDNKSGSYNQKIINYNNNCNYFF